MAFTLCNSQIYTLPLFRSQRRDRSIAMPPEILTHWSSCIYFLRSVGSCPGSHPVGSWTRYTDSPADKLWSNGLALLLWCWRSRDHEGCGDLPCFFPVQRRIRQLNSFLWRFLGQHVAGKGWLEKPPRWCSPSVIRQTWLWHDRLSHGLKKTNLNLCQRRNLAMVWFINWISHSLFISFK